MFDSVFSSISNFVTLFQNLFTGDYNGAFLLLTYGQDANCYDKDNLTPILWLIKYNNTPKGLEMIRLLMRFDGSVTTPFPSPENDSILHHLTRNKRLDLYLVYCIYHANPAYFQSVKNSGGSSVYQLAVLLENRKMAKFLLDSMLFHFFPPWIVVFQSASLVFSLWILLAEVGFFWGILDFSALTLIMNWLLQQRSIIIYRDRVPCGLILGYFLSLPFLLYAYRTLSLFSSSHTLFLLTIYFMILYLALKCRLHIRKGENQSVLVTRVISSAPQEGTEEEYFNSYDNTDKNARNTVKIVKDKFTGRVTVLRSSKGGVSGDGSDGERVIKGRSFGPPRICSHCLLDKRPVNEAPLVHCQHSCNACHAYRDHHCSYLMTCVTITNRRLFVLLHLLAFFFLIIVYTDINWIETAMLCDLATGMELQFCLWSNHPAIALFGYLTLFLSLYSLFVGVILQLFLVARHMTVSMIIRNKRSLWSFNHGKGGVWKGIKRIGTFLRTGRFKVSYTKLDAMESAAITAAAAAVNNEPSAVASTAASTSSAWLSRLERNDSNSLDHSTSSHYSNNSGRVRRDSYTREAPTATASPMTTQKKSGRRRVTFQLDAPAATTAAAVDRVINAPPSSLSPFEEEKGLLEDDLEDEDEVDDEEDYEEEEYDDDDDYIQSASNDTDSDGEVEEEGRSRDHRDLEAAEDDDRQRLLSSSNHSSKSNALGSFAKWR